MIGKIGIAIVLSLVLLLGTCAFAEETVPEWLLQIAQSNLTEIGYLPPELIEIVETEFEYDKAGQRWFCKQTIDAESYLRFVCDGNDENISFFTNGSYENGKLCRRFAASDGSIDWSYDPKKETWSVTEDDALATAQEAVMESFGVSLEELDALTLYDYLGECGAFDRQSGKFAWSYLFTWTDGKNDLYGVQVSPETGEVFSAWNYKEGRRLSALCADLSRELWKQLIDEGVAPLNHDRWSMSVEDRAAWSAKARPIVQAFLAEHSELVSYLHGIREEIYPDSNVDQIYLFTENAYGLPDENALSQEQAFEIAKAEAIRLGARADYIENQNPEKHGFYYDVTDAEHPLWKVHINQLFSDGDTKHRLLPTDAWGYLVVMDAHTGEILRVVERIVSTSMWELV